MRYMKVSFMMATCTDGVGIFISKVKVPMLIMDGIRGINCVAMVSDMTLEATFTEKDYLKIFV